MKHISLIILGCIVMACSQKTELREGVIAQEAYRDTVPVAVSEYETEYRILYGGMSSIDWPQAAKNNRGGYIVRLRLRKSATGTKPCMFIPWILMQIR